jgi:pyruvate/2-oxoglutarate dehydrogenase complex dihydrolipoamide dehydrogenase (E3) component
MPSSLVRVRRWAARDGSGSGGRKTALIERQYVGGTCINYGCTPTKTMVASAREAYLARRSSDYGVHDGPVSVDMAEVRQRKRDLVETFRAGSEQAIRDGKVDLLFGEASFTGPHSLQVRMNSGELLELTADTIVIDTGTSPSTPPIEGLKDVPSSTRPPSWSWIGYRSTC